MKRTCLIVLGVLLSGCPRAALGQDLLWRYESIVKTNGLAAIDSIGDLNGDGVSDFVIGTTLARGHLVLSGLDGTVLHWQQFEDPNPIQQLSSHGASVAGVGDWTGDGVVDYAVTAPDFSGPTLALHDIGLVRIFSGATHEPVASFSDRLQDDSFSNHGIFGLGDITGDGRPELMVQTNSIFGDRQSIYSASDGRLVRSRVNRGGFSRSVPVVADQDGDGVRDYVITDAGWGAAPTFPNNERRGRASLLSGATGQTLQTYTGPYLLARMGTDAACGGDWDGDGREDLVFSGGGYQIAGFDPFSPTAVYVYSGTTGGLIEEFTREAYRLPGDSSTGENFGYRIDSGKDVNGDGHPDLMVGVPSWGILEQFKLNMGMALVISGKTGSVLWQKIGWLDGMFLGAEFLMLDDHDGDGFDDWLLVNRGKLGTLKSSITLYRGAPGDRWTSCDGSDTGGVAPAASLRGAGSIGVGDNGFHLVVEGAPPNTAGVVLMGTDRSPVPFGQGHLCVGPPFIVAAGLTTDEAGEAALALDWTQAPFDSGPGEIRRGVVRSFHVLYTDPQSLQRDATNAVVVEFLP